MFLWFKWEYVKFIDNLEKDTIVDRHRVDIQLFYVKAAFVHVTISKRFLLHTWFSLFFLKLKFCDTVCLAQGFPDNLQQYL